jgi:hypothetical protein
MMVLMLAHAGEEFVAVAIVVLIWAGLRLLRERRERGGG